MAQQNAQNIQGPKMDWTKDAGSHKHFTEWREEAELLLDTVLSHIRNKTTKEKFVTLWAGKEARVYLNTINQGKRTVYSMTGQNPRQIQVQHTLS